MTPLDVIAEYFFKVCPFRRRFKLFEFINTIVCRIRKHKPRWSTITTLPSCERCDYGPSTGNSHSFTNRGHRKSRFQRSFLNASHPSKWMAGEVSCRHLSLSGEFTRLDSGKAGTPNPRKNGGNPPQLFKLHRRTQNQSAPTCVWFQSSYVHFGLTICW